MDGLITDVEATVRGYELCLYSGEQYDRRGVPKKNKKNMRSEVSPFSYSDASTSHRPCVTVASRL